jgi:hypothetical protein
MRSPPGDDGRSYGAARCGLQPGLFRANKTGHVLVNAVRVVVDKVPVLGSGKSITSASQLGAQAHGGAHGAGERAGAGVGWRLSSA